VYLDADHFKKINDAYGHAAGDEVLRDLSAILKAQLRKTDFVARVGGEEFVMVLPETSIEGAVQAAVKLREAIKGHVFLGERAVRVTASLGVTALSEGPSLKNASELIEEADKLAYQSKTTGRDRISSPRGQIV
jgi:diguanylate cyclase (GGDEF)-like protein